MISFAKNATVNISDGRSQKFIKQTKEIGDYLDSLNLPIEQHNKLCHMLAEQMTTAERDAFRYGVIIAGKLAKAAEKRGQI